MSRSTLFDCVRGVECWSLLSSLVSVRVECLSANVMFVNERQAKRGEVNLPYMSLGMRCVSHLCYKVHRVPKLTSLSMILLFVEWVEPKFCRSSTNFAQIRAGPANLCLSTGDFENGE